jgi:fimbrial chaperone protein
MFFSIGTSLHRTRRCVRLAVATFMTLLTASAIAGSFSVSPVRIYMQARERATAVTVVNESDSELVMQAELFQWKQKADGSDELTPTDDLILAPPILKLAPRARQVVRLANLRPLAPGGQQTYRLIVRELPEARGAKAQAQVQIALAFSLPVFITPPNARSKLACSVNRAAQGAVVATCENDGQAYAQPVTFVLTNSSGEQVLSRNVSGGYILPQIRRSFELAGGANPVLSGAATLAVTQDDGSKQTFNVQLSE